MGHPYVVAICVVVSSGWDKKSSTAKTNSAREEKHVVAGTGGGGGPGEVVGFCARVTLGEEVGLGVGIPVAWMEGDRVGWGVSKVGRDMGRGVSLFVGSGVDCWVGAFVMVGTETFIVGIIVCVTVGVIGDGVSGCSCRMLLLASLLLLLLLLLLSATKVPSKVRPTPTIAPTPRPASNSLLWYQGWISVMVQLDVKRL